MFYGAQIWEYKKYDVMGKLLRFFIKKMLLLPKNTPNYILDTLKLHFNYINKALSITYNRLSSKLAEIIIANRRFCPEDLLSLCNKINFVPHSKHCKPILHHLNTYEYVNLISNSINS